ncbi:hypothetical protein [Thiocystis violascens]|uniref:Uncharacterized protein n=1 Tax=Thiocystis violascens (strain ATCC 17096 / DSM 198 / 6111) TaxID=765911 RepID=I3YFB1_THIV6|nr:hypothetical protein [Thiocystis violascens]AFL75679.1 hypothetical protein Thivi_3837 [Thiocystis violascens DSM 198]
MDRKIVLSVLGAAILGFVAILLLMPATLDDITERLPWRIAQDEAGRTRVFGFTLGQTTLAEVRAVFREDGELNLFQTPGDPPHHAAEAFFEQIYLQRLRADFVIALEVDQPTLIGMYDRGLRISQLGSGSKKIKLNPDDAAALASRPIRSIGYLPKARLDTELLKQRFGPPSQERTEPETGIVHWLYPDRGLDIARAPNGKVVIQYVNPRAFDTLIEPLRDF